MLEDEYGISVPIFLISTADGVGLVPRHPLLYEESNSSSGVRMKGSEHSEFP